MATDAFALTDTPTGDILIAPDEAPVGGLTPAQISALQIATLQNDVALSMNDLGVNPSVVSDHSALVPPAAQVHSAGVQQDSSGKVKQTATFSLAGITADISKVLQSVLGGASGGSAAKAGTLASVAAKGSLTPQQVAAIQAQMAQNAAGTTSYSGLWVFLFGSMAVIALLIFTRPRRR